MEAGNVIALVTVTFDLACLLRHTITTPWWTAEVRIWLLLFCTVSISCVLVFGTLCNVLRGFLSVQRKNWHGRLRSVKTCEGLVNCVQELRLKAVDWTKAKELFPEKLCEISRCLFRGTISNHRPIKCRFHLHHISRWCSLSFCCWLMYSAADWTSMVQGTRKKLHDY